MGHPFMPVVGFIVALVCSQYAYGSLTSDLQALNLSSGTLIGRPSNFTQRWSTYHAPRYTVSVQPMTDGDVAKIITYATTSQTPFLSTGGGHGFPTTLGRLHHGIDLDLSRFDRVSVDADANTITIGGAVRFKDILEPLGRVKKELPIGSSSCVGMVGATIGGGVSRLNGVHGMLVDSLLSVKLVTADGNVTRASNVENPDLFWALRGAGSNFGTILEATYRIYDETAPLSLVADFLFAPNASRSILQYFQSFGNDLPAKLSFIFYATYSSALGGSVIIVNAVYAGPQAEGKAYLRPLLDLTSIRSNLTMVPWANVNSASFFGLESPNAPCPTNAIHNVYGGAVKHFDIPTFQTFYENLDHLLSSNPEQLSGTSYSIEFFSKQAVQAIPIKSTAYPWRDITAHLLLVFSYANSTGTLDRDINAFARSARSNFTAASGFERSQIIVSYGHGDEDRETLYSAENLPRLRALKAKWDPGNAYRFTHPLIV